MMIISSKNVFVLALLFLLPFVAVAQNIAFKKITKGDFSNKIYLEFSVVAKSVTLLRAESRKKVKDTKQLIYEKHETYQSGEHKIYDYKDLKLEYFYYYKIEKADGKAENYGYITTIADVESQKIPSDTTNSTKQPILKGEVKITKALNGNNKIVSLTIDDATLEAVKKKGGSFKVERSEKEQMMGSEVTFTKPKFIELNSIVKAVFTDKNVNDKVGRYKYVVVIFDKDGKEIRRSNEIEINLKK
jgi:hypothetical protein